MQTNAGLRLWETQKHQGTGLCVGLDPHFDPDSELNAAFYSEFANRPAARSLKELFGAVTVSLQSHYLQQVSAVSGYRLISGA
jgi:hypothetical protein